MSISRVLVIGGAGYIGSHTVESLLADGYQVAVIDNLSTGRKEHILPGIKFEKVSILNVPGLNRAFAKFQPQAVIHLAALKAAGESMEKAVDYSETNLVGTINILKAMVEHGVKHLVFSSSAACYGEPRYLPIDESHPLNPVNYYGVTKKIMEEIISWYAKVYGINYIALRYFNAAGHTPSTKITVVEKNPQNLIPIILEAAMGKRKKFQIFGNDYPTDDGTCLRDYIHVCDLARAHSLSLIYLENYNDSLTLNLGTGESFSVLDVYHAACEVTGIDIPMEIAPRRPGDSTSIYAKSTLATKKIKWKAEYKNIRDMISHAWDSYLRSPTRDLKK